MNTEEYNIKIKELRKERDFHQREANKLAIEMDNLVNLIDKEKIDWMLGKYVKFDNRSKGGYLEFFYIDRIESRPRGYTIYGKGFNISKFCINIKNICTLLIEDKDLDCISEISKEDFYKAFDGYVKILREELSNIKNYKSLGDQFAFKKSMIEATVELKDDNSLSNKVLAILKTE